MGVLFSACAPLPTAGQAVILSAKQIRTFQGSVAAKPQAPSHFYRLVFDPWPSAVAPTVWRSVFSPGDALLDLRLPARLPFQIRGPDPSLAVGFF